MRNRANEAFRTGHTVCQEFLMFRFFWQSSRFPFSLRNVQCPRRKSLLWTTPSRSVRWKLAGSDEKVSGTQQISKLGNRPTFSSLFNESIQQEPVQNSISPRYTTANDRTVTDYVLSLTGNPKAESSRSREWGTRTATIIAQHGLRVERPVGGDKIADDPLLLELCVFEKRFLSDHD